MTLPVLLLSIRVYLCAEPVENFLGPISTNFWLGRGGLI